MKQIDFAAMLPDTQTLMLVNSNALSIPLADRSVHCVVTSPPYFGQRDYGTAAWMGGNAECDHNPQKPDGGDRADRTLPLGRGGLYRDTCGKCGAIRVDNQLGLEQTPEKYVTNMVAVFREVWRVLRDDGTLWLNLGDSYNGSGGAGGDYNTGGIKEGQPKYPGRNIDGLKQKDLIGIPWRVAFALQADGWYLRSEIIWAKGVSGQRDIWKNAYNAAIAEGVSEDVAIRIADAVDPYVGNPMPESTQDRPTKSHEHVFLLTKSKKYFYDIEAIKEPMSDATAKRDKNGFNGAFKGQFNGSPTEKRWQDGRPIAEPKFFDPAGRNRRTVWAIPARIDSVMRLRNDLTPDQREHVIKELVRQGII